LKCQMETIMSCKNMQLHAWWQAQSVQYVVIKFRGAVGFCIILLRKFSTIPNFLSV
jgi:hypothetical protein